MVTGGHQIHWTVDIFSDPIHNRTHRERSGVKATQKGKKKGKERVQELSEPARIANAIQGLADENISAAINKFLKVTEELGRLPTSAFSYWNVVAGTGDVSVKSSAALMAVGLGLGLFLTTYLYKQVTDTESRPDLRSVATHNPLDNPDYNDARQDVTKAANHPGYIAAYGVTGAIGVAGVLTGLIAAKEAMGDQAWQNAKFYPVLWAAYNLMKAQADVMRSLKATPATFVLVQADKARDYYFANPPNASDV